MEDDEWPDNKTVNAAENPFQVYVNELAEAYHAGNTEKSKKTYVGNDEDLKFVKYQIYRAARNINLGSRIRVLKNTDKGGYDVYFKLAAPKVRKKASN